jgi:tryptophan synthase alpha chain
MANAGADLVEIGIPFSDPVAEGEVITAANVRALAAGAKLPRIFDMVRAVRKNTDVPLVFLTYLNPVFKYGYEKFFAACESSGMDGVIIPDLPYEEKGELTGIAALHGIDVVTLIAPTSSERVRTLASGAHGFVYLVSSMGVTGVRKQISTDISSIVREIRQATQTPVAVGFGISEPTQAALIAREADERCKGIRVQQRAYEKDGVRTQGGRLVYLVFVYDEILAQDGDGHVLFDL